MEKIIFKMKQNTGGQIDVVSAARNNFRFHI